jgi:hypothetical protein
VILFPYKSQNAPFMNSRFYLFLVLLLSLLPFYSEATHIVGGTLTYTHLGGSSYQVTLKLYRDCSGISLPGSVTINVRAANGDDFNPSRDINIPLTSSSFVPAFVDTCVIKPNVCVQEGIYTKVVNNLPGGGYHLYYNVCCRNGSLVNVNSPLTTGASFYTDIPSLPNIWLEDFSLANNTTVDAGVTAWSRTLGAPGPTNYAKVNNNLFEASKTNGQVVWTSQVINISGRPGGVNLNADLAESGTLGSTDTIQVFYKLNGGPEILFPTNGRKIDDFGSVNASATNLVGNTVQIVVKMNNHNANLYQLDNVMVWDNTITNSSPSFTNFPPIFVCNGTPLVFNNAATDSNGDSLVYSLYRPYTDASPTYAGTTINFTPITYNAGYGTTNPMGGAAGSVTIDATGTLRTTPTALGQFVVGVKVSEFRNGVLLNEVTRDFQFNVLNCPPPGKASFASAKVCSGKSLTFNNTSPASMTNFTWNFGDAASGASNTSILRNPTHTFTTTGSYTVTLISNPNSACADTTHQVVTVSSVTAAYTPPATNCMNQSVSFTDASTAVGTTVTGWLWDFGDGSTSAVKNPTHTYTSAATYSIKLVATNGFGCKDSVTKSLVINPLAIVSTGGPVTVCANNPAVPLTGTVSNATGGAWTPAPPTAGAGTYSPNASTLITTYSLSNADTTAHSVTLTLTSTGNNTGCPAVTATKVITINRTPIVSAGPNKTVCANNRAVAVSGAILNAASATWTTNGSGTFFPNANTLVMTYTPSDADTAAHSVTLTLTTPVAGGCAAVAKSMTITIVPKPSANFTPPASVCANNAVINLVGSVTQASGGTWTSNGTGTFGNANALSTTYTPSAADKTAGTVTLTLTTTGMVSNCNAVSVSKTISITPAPTSTPGPNQTLCKNNAVATLSGSVSVATGGQWTTNGTGSFTPNANTLNATYTPSVSDLSVGNVTLTLTTTTGAPTCNAVANSLTVTYTPSPTSNPGGPVSVCANNPGVALVGSVTVATGGAWSGGAGAFSPNATSLTTTYTPTAGEISAGTVTLTLTTTTGNGNCNPVAANKVVTITPAPTVTVNGPASVCANNSSINVTATLTVATGVAWTSNGTGSFSAVTPTSATYTPSVADKTSGTVTITATTNAGNGTCTLVAANKVITITVAPTVSIASANAVCANNADISLTGSVTAPATGGAWTSNGTGSFTPNAGTLIATYHPSATDITNGSVILTLTTTGSSPSCVEVNTTKTVTITPAPTVSVGPAVSVCANNNLVNITATLTVATGVQWTTNGSGTFGNSTALTTTYTPSATDITNGTVTLTATTNAGNGTCIPVAATKVVTITVAPTVSIAAVAPVCANNATINLNGSVTAPATGGTWTSNGTGTFGNANALITTYTPSATDITNGSVIFTLTTTGSSPSCVEVNTTRTVTITPAPTVTPGPAQSVCANNSVVTLNASQTVATAGIWTSNGTGAFGSATSLNTTYTPSAADKAVTPNTITLTWTTTAQGNCNAVSNTLALTITPSPTSNAGPDKTVCSNNASVGITGSVTVATGGTWTTAGNGTFTPSANALTMTYNPGAADLAVGIVNLFLTTTGNGTCLAAKDTVKIVIFNAPSISGLSNVNICKNNAASVPVNATITNGPAVTLWTTNGTGTFANASAAATTYTPSAADVASGAVTLTITANKTSAGASCTAVSSSMVVTFTTAPTVNAGGDQTVCANNAVTTIAGSETIATGGTWTTNGTGTFGNANALSTTYTPSPADTVLHTVTLTLTTTGNGNCTAVSDAMVLTISPKPTSAPGPNQTVCANNASVTLAGNVSSVSTGGQWTTGGTGTFAPNANTLNATYLPSAADKTAASVILTLTTTGNGNCVAVSKPMTVTITPSPTISAGANRSICANNPTLTLAGTETVATGGTWTGGTGLFSNPNSLTSTYTASAAEIAATTVTLTLVSTGNGTCNAVQSQMVITVTPAPTVDAGSDQTICSTSPNAALNGTVTVATGGSWTSNGTGSFSPNANILNASYVPSAADKTAGNITLTLTTTGIGNCTAVVDEMVITITPNPTSSAGPNQTVCTNDFPIALAGTGAPSAWQGGTGTFAPSRNVLNPSYTPSAAEITAQTVTLTLQPNVVPGCTPAATTVTITIPPGPVVSAGPNQTVCGDVNSVTLAGSVTHAAGGTWTTNGTGTFSPNANTIAASYLPSAADKTAGTVTLTLTSTGNGFCTAESASMILTITPAPAISAGPDLSRCADVASVPVTGTKNAVVSSVIWTTLGSGSFSSNTALSTNYTPSTADTTAHSVKLVITSVGTGTCVTVTDTMKISFTPAPVVNAGPAQTICADSAFIKLGGSVTVATGGTWTGGAGGVYSPNNTSLNTSYFPTAADTAAGSITFTLTTSGQGTCNAVSKTVVVTINHAPVVSAGPNKTVCADVTGVLLNGAFVNNAGGGTWTSNGTGTFAPNANTVLATYNFSAADKTGGTVTLTLKSTGNGSCKQKSSQVVLTITTAPTISAGPSRTICADANTVPLAGSVTVATGGTWTTGGTGTFSPNANTLTATYNVSAADKTSSPITLTLTSTGNGTCTPVTSTMTITVTPAPTVSAGPAQTICADASATLNGSITVATGATWTSNGTGTFAPNATTLNATYVPSAAERSSAVNITRTLTLTTTGNGTCNPVTSNMVLTITPAPTVSAGADVSVCGNNASVALNGTETVATGGTWTTNGTGTFGNANALVTNYTPSALDISNGSVDLTLTTTGNGTCNAVTSTKIVAISPAPTVNGGGNRSVCANNPVVTLIGSITAPATGGTWTTNGTGSFGNANALSTTYTPSGADITAGTVTLTLTSTGNANCNPVSNNVVVTITPAPTVNPGAAQSVCANNASVTLNGLVTVATGGNWTTNGTGTFAPNASTLNATYTPSAADTAAHGVILTLTTTGNGTCNAVSATKVITITPQPVINAGADQTVCADLATVNLNGGITVAAGSTWTTSGSGVFGNASNPVTTYTPSVTDKTNGVITLTLTPNGFGTCALVTDQMILNITPVPTVNAGGDQTICADLNSIVLTGAKTVATGVMWSSTGSGTFSPSNTSLNGFYTPSAADRTGGVPITIKITTTGNGTCNPVSSQFTLTITPAPTVNANVDQTVCADIAGVTLNGSITVAGGAAWTTSGSGTFAPNNVTLNAAYTPSAADKTAGSVTLTLTTTGNGTCNAVSDQMKIFITPAPTVNAGADLNMCADGGSVVVNGSVTVATGGTWSTASGTGTFSPDPNTLLMTFTPSALQITQGFARLTLTTTGNGTCVPVSDQMQINIAPIPVVDAGPNQTVCADLANVQLAGTVSNATGGHWTTSGTGTFNNANLLNATYAPSAADKIAGTITLTLTSTGNGLCSAYSKNMALKITPLPSVDAGPPTICSNTPSVALSGTVVNAAGGKWTTTGTGTFNPSANVLSTSYVPSAADVLSGGVTLTLTTTGTGACTAVSDNINLVLQGPPTANAGSDQVVCTNNSAVSLTGVVGGAATGGTWTSTGGGAFAPNANTLIATYTPSAIDIFNGNVSITLTTTGVGACNPSSDLMKVTITPPPTVSAGGNQTVCADATGVTLNGSVTVATGGTWTSNGTGTFLPNANTLNATYKPSAADTTAHSVTLTLTTTGNGLCNAVTDQMIITITPAPTAFAGPDYIICADAGGVGLSGIVSVATGGTWTSNNGSGTFANPNDVNTLYSFSAADRTIGSVKLILTTTGNGTCNAAKDTLSITIPPAPVVTASALNSCSDAPNIPLSGSVTNATGGMWTSNSALGGTFLPNNTTLNASYDPGPGETTVNLTLTSTGNGTCNAVSVTFNLNIQPAPTANAGPDQTICKNNTAVALNGIIGGGSVTGIWTTTGSGTFSPTNTASSTTLNATYTPAAADLAADSVMLILTSTANGICSADIDTMMVRFTPAPTVDAGPGIVCSQNPTLALNGTFTVATGIQWSTNGTGTFTPDNLTAIATYNLSGSDLTTGTINITITTTGVGNCAPVSDVLVLNVANAPSANGGGNKTVCANNRNVALNGSILHAGGGVWSTLGTGSFSLANSTLINTYIPSDADTTAGTVKLILTTTGNLPCSAVTDTVVVTITDAPAINLGPSTVCSNNPPLNLKASITVAAGGTWSASSAPLNGVFGNPVALSTTYTPSGKDITNGSVTLTFTTNPTGGGCVATQKSIALFITGAPTAGAGADKTVCADTASIPLNGIISGATNGDWSILSGTGSVTGPGNPSFYVPSAADTAAGIVTLILTTTGNGSCLADTDTLNIAITNAPTINAGANQVICADKNSINLNGLITTSTGGNWTTSGSGSFGNAALPVTTYLPSLTDKTTSPILLILTTSGNGNCRAKKDTVLLTITPAPTVNATPATICSDDAADALSGTVTVATGGAWTTTGTGTFAPNANTLNASYIVSNPDRIATTVKLYLTTTGNGTCNSVKDSITVNIVPPPTADAGADQSICAAAGTISLSGSVVTATGGVWSSFTGAGVSGGGTYNPNANTLATTYNLTAADTAARVITFVLTTTGNNGCTPAKDSATVFMTPAPVAIVNAGLDQVVCADVLQVNLNGNVENANGGVWVTNGNGVFTPSPFVLNAQYIPDAVDKASATPITMVLTSIGNGICSPVTDTMLVTITPAPTVTLPANATICADVANVPLNAVLTVATNGTWTTSGGGSFTPSANNKATTYHPVPVDFADSTVIFTFTTTTGNGTCNPVSANTKIFITPAPTVEAGPDQIVCADNNNVLISGSLTVATGGKWTSSGTGSFGNVNNLSTSYTPSPADLTAGSVKLYLTSTVGNGTCIPVKDSLLLTITTGPTVDPGAAQTICADAAGVTLAGSVSIASGGVWTSAGTGAFFPNNVDLTGTYVPSATDTAAHTVTLTLTTTGNGTCNAVDSTVIITITPAPIINAGPDQATCKDAVNVALTGTVITATGGLWTTSGSGAFAPANSLVTTYTPSTADTTAGLVILTLTSTTGNLTCNPVKDQMKITLNPTPTVNAGPDVIVCADVDSVSLNGVVKLAGGGKWSIFSGTGVITNVNSLNTAYTPSAGDKAGGLVRLVLTTTGNNGCNPHSDTMKITITPAPTVDAGVVAPICKDAVSIALNGTKTVATGAAWTTGGTGVFSPDPDILNPSYTPSAADKSAGLVTLYMTTTGNGSCHSVMDSVKLSFTPVPTISAGPDQSVCGNNGVVTLAGSMNIATSAVWTTSGTGGFGNAANLATTYTPSAADVTAGGVTLTLTSTAQGTCNPVFDRMIVTITNAPVASPGSAQTVCGNNAAVKLNGSVTVATGGLWSTSNGTGTFSPNDSTLVTTYIPSSADTAAGSVTLKLTTTGNANCNAVKDSVVVTISNTPVAAIAAIPSICADAASVTLNGSVAVATGGTWTSTGTGVFALNTSDLTGSYFPSVADRAAGTIGLTLTTTGNGNCLSVVANRSFTITRKPVVSAGGPKTICADAAGVFIIGTVVPGGGLAGPGTGTWTSSGSGSFNPNPNTLGITYVPSAADIAAGKVDLTLASTSNGTCNAVTDLMALTITKAPTANAGPDKTTCADAASFALGGTVTVATGGTWTTSGTGNFTPNANSLNVSYHPSAADTTAHSVILTLTTTGNGTCNAVSDPMTLTIPPAPVVSTGGGSVCSDVTGLSLNGSVLNAGGGQWTSSGTGVFSPNAFTLAVSYTPSAADIAAGSAVLTLTSTGNGTCVPVSAIANVTITPLPVSDAGPDRIICRGSKLGLLPNQQSVNNSYKWFTTSGALISGSMLANVTANSDTLFVLMATDQKGCSTRDTLEVFVADPPVFALANHFCLANGLVINSNAVPAAPANGAFQWFENNNPILGENNPSALAIGTVGTYIIEYKFGTCAAYDTTVVTLPPQLYSLDTITCSGAALTIKTTNVAGATYSWSATGLGTITPPNNGFSVNITAVTNNLTADSSDFIAAVTDNVGCVSHDTVKVKTVPPPILTLANTQSCAGDTVFLNGKASNVPSSLSSSAQYTWFKNGTNLNVNDTTSQLAVTSSANYTLIYKIGGCSANGGSVVAFNPKPSISLSDIDHCFDGGGPADLNAGNGFTTYKWYSLAVPDTLATRPDVASPIFTVYGPGRYYVKVTNVFNCASSGSILVNAVCSPTLEPPTGFFPMDDPSSIDSIADPLRHKDLYFRPFGNFKYAKNIQFTIFNRWGEIMYYSEDPRRGWDGKYRGVLMETGTYPWTLYYEGLNEQYKGPYRKSGSVTIIK